MANRYTFYESFYAAAMLLDDDERLEFYDGLNRYVFMGEEPQAEPGTKLEMAFLLSLPNVKSSVDRNEILDRARRDKAEKAEAKRAKKKSKNEHDSA